MRFMPKDESTCCVTAPGMASKNAGPVVKGSATGISQLRGSESNAVGEGRTATTAVELADERKGGRRQHVLKDKWGEKRRDVPWCQRCRVACRTQRRHRCLPWGSACRTRQFRPLQSYTLKQSASPSLRRRADTYPLPLKICGIRSSCVSSLPRSRRARDAP